VFNAGGGRCKKRGGAGISFAHKWAWRRAREGGRKDIECIGFNCNYSIIEYF